MENQQPNTPPVTTAPQTPPPAPAPAAPAAAPAPAGATTAVPKAGMSWGPAAGIAVLALLVMGAAAYYYFAVLSPQLAASNAVPPMQNEAQTPQNTAPSFDQLQAQLNASDESSAGTDVNNLDQSLQN